MTPARARAARGDYTVLLFAEAKVCARLTVQYMRADGVRAKAAWYKLTGEMLACQHWQRVENKLARMIFDEAVAIRRGATI